MFDELDTVVLTRDIDEYNLKEGDLGVVVHAYASKKTLEVEFVTAAGKTIAVLALTSKDIRPINRGEILHVRGFATA